MNMIFRYLTMLSLLALSYSVSAENQWYVGPVYRIAFISGDGSFLASFKNGVLDDCKNKNVSFKSNDVGPERLKGVYTMAITSLTTGVNMGVVINKSINGPGGECRATGMTAEIRSN